MFDMVLNTPLNIIDLHNIFYNTAYFLDQLFTWWQGYT